MKRNSLINKFLSFSIGSWISIIIGVLGTLLITRLFSPDQTGIVSMFEPFANITTIFIICGIDQSFMRFFYVEKEENRKNFLFNCFKLPMIINGIFIIIFFLFRKYILNFFFEIYSFKLFLILCFYISLLIFNKFAFLVIRMQQKGTTYSILLVIQKVSYILSIILIALFINNDYKALIISTVISLLVSTIIAMICEHNYWNIFTLNKRKTNITQKEIFCYGIPLVFTFVINWLFEFVDKLTIGYFWNGSEIGIYDAAAKIVKILSVIQASFTTFWIPVAFEKYETNPDDTQFFEKVNLLITTAMFFGGILVILFRDIIVLLLGKSYRLAAFMVPFLIFTPIMYTISETTVLGINFNKKQRSHTYIALISCATNVLGNLLLVPKYGGVGASISTGLSYIVFFSARTYISYRYFKVNYHLKEFYIMTFSFIIYSLYATFNKFGIVYVLLGILEVAILYILYGKHVKKFIKFKSKSIT